MTIEKTTIIILKITRSIYSKLPDPSVFVSADSHTRPSDPVISGCKSSPHVLTVQPSVFPSLSVPSVSHSLTYIQEIFTLRLPHSGQPEIHVCVTTA